MKLDLMKLWDRLLQVPAMCWGARHLPGFTQQFPKSDPCHFWKAKDFGKKDGLHKRMDTKVIFSEGMTISRTEMGFKVTTNSRICANRFVHFVLFCISYPMGL